jgi:hypothetical protein
LEINYPWSREIAEYVPKNLEIPEFPEILFIDVKFSFLYFFGRLLDFSHMPQYYFKSSGPSVVSLYLKLSNVQSAQFPYTLVLATESYPFSSLSLLRVLSGATLYPLVPLTTTFQLPWKEMSVGTEITTSEIFLVPPFHYQTSLATGNSLTLTADLSQVSLPSFLPIQELNAVLSTSWEWNLSLQLGRCDLPSCSLTDVFDITVSLDGVPLPSWDALSLCVVCSIFFLNMKIFIHPNF